MYAPPQFYERTLGRVFVTCEAARCYTQQGIIYALIALICLLSCLYGYSMGYYMHAIVRTIQIH